MSVFNYPIFLCFIIFILWFAYERSKIKRAEQSQNDNFWKNESDANFSRRKNLDLLTYITIPYESFPMDQYDIEALKPIEEKLSSMSDKRILNLTGKTSTEIKTEYGASNLPLLSEYDENYTELVKTLNEYAHILFEAGYVDDAATVLEFAISTGSDIKGTFVLLGDIYISRGQLEKIDELKMMAGQLDSLMKNPIINALDDAVSAVRES